MTGRTNEADIAAVIDVARAYYDGSIAADEKLLTGAFHPRASIVGNLQGKLVWQTLEEFIDECKQEADGAGPGTWRIEAVSILGDTAEIKFGNEFAGEWYTDDLSLLRVDGRWCIVHKTWYLHPPVDRPEAPG